MQQDEERELLMRLRSGEEQAFVELVTAWTPLMRRVASNFVKSQASVDEVVQETWLAVVRGLPAFRGESALRTWSLSILSNIARKYGVKDARATPWSSLSPAEEGRTENPGRFRAAGEQWEGHWTSLGEPGKWGPERLALSGEIRRALIKALHALPERQRTVVALRDIDGLTSEEVCDVLGVSAANQRVLLHRGRVQLRTALETFVTGGTDD